MAVIIAMRGLFAFASVSLAAATKETPISRVVTMLDKMKEEVLEVSKDTQANFEEFTKTTADSIRQFKTSLDDGQEVLDEASANLKAAQAAQEQATAQITEASQASAAKENEIKSATATREEETKLFNEAQAEYMDTSSAIERAIPILKQGTSTNFLQASSSDDTLSALEAIVSASRVESSSKNKLLSLLQTNASDDDDDDDDAPSMDRQSGTDIIIEQLEDMADETSKALRDLQDEERNKQHAFDMLAQSLRNGIKDDEEQIESGKKQQTASQEEIGTNNGLIAESSEKVKVSKEGLQQTQQEAMLSAKQHEQTMGELDEELHVLDEAKNIIQSTTGNAESAQYKSDDASEPEPEEESFLQMKVRSRSSPSKRAVAVLKKLGLNTLATRVSTAIRMGAGSKAPFDKVTKMIGNMIDHLVKKQQEEEEQMAFCTKEMAKEKESREKLTSENEKYQTRGDKTAATIAQLQERLENAATEESDATAALAEMTSLRQKEKTDNTKAIKDFEEGLEGVQQAIKLLRDHYKISAGESFLQLSTQGAEGIIEMMEQASMDFSKSLAETRTNEDVAVSQFNEDSQRMKVQQASLKSEIAAKTQSLASEKAKFEEVSSDLTQIQARQEAQAKAEQTIRAQCMPKQETPEEKMAKRKEEIEGLKRALDILSESSGASFLETAMKTVRKANRVG